jgi:hypothetical protein
MPKQCDGEHIARVLGWVVIWALMKTLGDILVQERGEAGVDEVTVVERVVLEEHDVGCEKGILQPGMVYIAELYATQCEEAVLELGMEARGDGAGGGQATGNGGLVKLAMEYTAIEVGVVGGTEEVAEEFTGEHEGKEGARRGREGVIVERIDEDVFHCVLEAVERGEHCVGEEEERVERAGWMI